MQKSLDGDWMRSWSRSKRRARRGGDHRVSQFSVNKSNNKKSVDAGIVVGREISFKEDKNEVSC